MPFKYPPEESRSDEAYYNSIIEPTDVVKTLSDHANIQRLQRQVNEASLLPLEPAITLHHTLGDVFNPIVPEYEEDRVVRLEALASKIAALISGEMQELVKIVDPATSDRCIRLVRNSIGALVIQQNSGDFSDPDSK